MGNVLNFPYQSETPGIPKRTLARLTRSVKKSRSAALLLLAGVVFIQLVRSPLIHCPGTNLGGMELSSQWIGSQSHVFRMLLNIAFLVV